MLKKSIPQKSFHLFSCFSFLVLLSLNANAQLTGSRIISSSSSTYPGLTAAFDSLNTQGVGKGGIIFYVTAGQTFNESQLSLKATGTSAKPILFQKSGVGADPVIKVKGTSGITDAAILLVGSDYITFDGLKIMDGGSSSSDFTEYGFYLIRMSDVDACQYVTIKNCTILLHNANTSSIAIYQRNVDSTGTVTAPSSTAGQFLANKIYSNNISNTWAGIRIAGSATAGYYDENMEIGVSGGNHVIYGGAGGTTSNYGILAGAMKNSKIANNTVRTDSGNATNNTYGIRTTSAADGAVNVYRNTISISSDLPSFGNVLPLFVVSSGTATDSVNVYENIVEKCKVDSAGGSSSADFRAIQCNSQVGHLNVFNNIIRNNFQNSTSGTNPPLPCSGINYSGGINYIGIYIGTNTDSSYKINIHDNEMYGNRCVTDYMGISSQALKSNIYANNIHNDTLITSSGTKWFVGVYVPGADQNVYLNHIHHLYSTSSASSYMYGILDNTYQSTTANIYSNEIDSINTEKGAISGIEHNQSGCLSSSSDTVTMNIYGNKIYSLVNNTGAYTVRGISTRLTPGGLLYANVYNNMIYNLQSFKAGLSNGVSGIYADKNSIMRAFNNTVYLAQDSFYGSSEAIFLSSSAKGDFRNNILVNTSAGRSIAYATDGSSTYSYYSDSSNNNLFYGGSSSLKHLIFSDGGGNTDSVLSTFKTRIGKKRETNSLWTLPAFISSMNLHLDPSKNCNIKARGKAINSPITVSFDFDNNLRSNTNPDLGADEFQATNPGLWIGVHNSTWTAPVNWCNDTLPTDSVDANITSIALNMPDQSSGTAQCRNLLIDSFTSVTVSGGTFNLNGNLINNASFINTTGGIFNLNGAASQSLKSPSMLTFYTLGLTGNSTKFFDKNISVIKSLNINTGLLDLSTDSLFLKGDMVNNSAYTGKGKVILIGGSFSTHQLSGKGIFSNLILNDTFGAVLKSPVRISGDLAFAAGKFILDSNDLTLSATTALTGYSNKNYFLTGPKGSLVKEGIDTSLLIFPVGTKTGYAAVSFKDKNNTGDTLGVRVSDPLFDSIFNPALPTGTGNFVKKQWYLKEKKAGGSSADIVLNWSLNDEVHAPFTIVGFNSGSGWVKTSGTINKQSATLSGFSTLNGSYAVYKPGTDTNDVGVSAILQPLKNSCGIPITVVKVKVHNYGMVPQANNFNVTIKVSGSATASAIIPFKDTIYSGRDTILTVSFSPALNTTKGGTYTISAYTDLKNDQYRTNDTARLTATIFALPAAHFSNTAACLNDSAYFTDSSLAGSGTISNYAWSFGNGFTSNKKAPSTIFSRSGSYAINLKITNSNGCVDSTYKTIKIDTVIAGFGKTGPAKNGTMKFKATDTTLAAYSWDFGDKSTFGSGYAVSHQYSNGKYTALLKVTNARGCTASATDTFSISVSDTNDVGISGIFLPANKSCGMLTSSVQLKVKNYASADQSNSFNINVKISGTASLSSVVSFSGTLRSGKDTAISISFSPAWNTVNGGTFKITAYVDLKGDQFRSNDTAVSNVTIYALPKAKFGHSPACPADTTHFYDSSTVASGSISSWLWQFGNGTSSKITNPSVLYGKTGSYTVKLKISTTNGCSDSATQLIKVDTVIAAFTHGLLSTDGTTGFKAADTILNKYSWDFGDKSPPGSNYKTTYKYAKGRYFATLTVSDKKGCKASSSDSVLFIPTGIDEVNNSFNVSVYPNPFSGSTLLSYTLDEASGVQIEITDILGRQVQSFIPGIQTNGIHILKLDAAALKMNPGLYFIKMTLGDKMIVKKITLLGE